MARNNIYTTMASNLKKEYASLGEEASELYKRNYIPLPKDFDAGEKGAANFEKEADAIANELDRSGLQFDAIITKKRSASFSKSITIKDPEDLSLDELLALSEKSHSDKYFMYVLASLDKVVVIDATSADCTASLLAIAPGALNIAVITKADNGHRANVLELLMSAGSKSQLGLFNFGDVKAYSKAAVTALHDEGGNCTVLSFASNITGEGGSFVLNSMYNGGSIVHARNFISASSINSYAGLNDMSFCLGSQQMDILDYIINGAEGSKAESRSKAVALDSAKCIMKGFAKLAKGARNSTSYIYQRGISLDRNAYIEALPDMSIDESMVKATHSSAVAPVDEGALFYMMSRGLDYDSSKKLLLLSFIGDIISRFSSGYAAIIAASLIERKISSKEVSSVPSASADIMPIFSKAEGLEEHYKYRK